jgi:hypothetical protein
VKGKLFWREMRRDRGLARWRVVMPNEEEVLSALKAGMARVGGVVRDWMVQAPPRPGAAGSCAGQRWRW